MYIPKNRLWAPKTAPAPSPEDTKLPATPGHSGTGPEVKNAVLCPQCPAAQGCAAPRGVPVLAACGHLADMEVRSAAKLVSAAKLISVSLASELSGTLQHFCRLFDDFSIPGRFRPGTALKINDFLKDFNQKLKVLWFPAAPNPARRSKSILFQRIFSRNRRFFSSRPLPTRPGAQNQYFFKGF